MLAGILVDLNVVISETALFIRERAVDQLLQLPDLKRFELKNLGARNERTVYIKERIVSGRSDQPEISAFDIGEENILLRFVEVMDLVDEQDRLLTGCAKPICRSSDDAPHFGDIALHAAQPHELRVRHVRNYVRERGFSGAGRTRED